MSGPLAALHVDWGGSAKSGPPYALYFFKERQYIRWNVDDECLYDGYPADIATGWPGLLEAFPSVPISGAVHVPAWRNRIFFFFRGQDHALAWDVANHQADPDLVPVASLLPSALTGTGHFAPIYVDRGDSQTVYVFRGDEYTRFTISDGTPPEREDDGYPRKIGDGWTGGLTVAPTCGVSLRWTKRSAALSNHKLYFFLGELYTRWDITSHSTNYRLDIPSGWKGWPDFE
jgi:hypothetical protein